MRFKLEIELGNDAMMTPPDVAVALESVAMGLRNWGFMDPDSRSIRDENGNKVGTWEVTK